jgi:hypothetical protein
VAKLKDSTSVDCSAANYVRPVVSEPTGLNLGWQADLVLCGCPAIIAHQEHAIGKPFPVQRPTAWYGVNAHKIGWRTVEYVDAFKLVALKVLGTHGCGLTVRKNHVPHTQPSKHEQATE